MKFIFLFFAAIPFHLFADEFQTTKRDSNFAELMQTLDFNAPGVAFEYKNSGTSVGLKVERDGKKIGKWVPENSATHVEGQVVAYTLGRFLNMGQIVVPSEYYEVTGAALEQFKVMLERARETNKWRRINRDETLEKISRDGRLLGVHMMHTKFDSPEVRGLADASSNTINRSHPVAQFIRASGPMPTDRLINLGVKDKEGKLPVESELVLSRQFSQIMVLDILTGQWDRWSGGNIEAGYEDGRVFFWSRDNGGTSLNGSGVLKKYSSIVTRFDRGQVERLKRLSELLSVEATAKSLAAQLKLKAAKPGTLLARVNALLAHIQAQVDSYGEEKAYFPNR